MGKLVEKMSSLIKVAKELGWVSEESAEKCLTDNMELGHKSIQVLSDVLNNFSAASDMLGRVDNHCGDSDVVKVCGMLAGYGLALEFEEKNGDEWDDRKKAASIFCSRNKNIFKTEIENLLGPEYVPIINDWRVEPDYKALPDRAELAAERGFFLKWANEHSTLRQKLIKGVYELFLKDSSYDVVPNSDYGTVFPFI